MLKVKVAIKSGKLIVYVNGVEVASVGPWALTKAIVEATPNKLDDNVKLLEGPINSFDKEFELGDKPKDEEVHG